MSMMNMTMNGAAVALDEATLRNVTGGSLSWFSDIGDELSGWVCDMSRTVSSVGGDLLEGGAAEAAVDAGAEGAEAGSCLGPIGAAAGAVIGAGIGYLAYKFF